MSAPSATQSTPSTQTTDVTPQSIPSIPQIQSLPSTEPTAPDRPVEPAQPKRPAKSTGSMFRSLSVRNYRLFAGGQLVSNTGTWMQRIAQDWLVLALTHSGTALGVVTALQFLPILLFSVWGGSLADRYPKRTMLMITQTVMGVLAAVLGVLTVSGVIATWQIYLFALGLGMIAAVDTPARQSFVVEMVGPEHLQNAVSLNSANFNLARVVGPAVAGLLIGLFSSQVFGSGIVFLINAISYVAVVVGLLAIRTRDLLPAKLVARARGQQLEGFRYLRTRPDLLAVLAVVAVFGTMGLNFPVVLPLFTTRVFHAGASAYGLVSAVMAVGSLAGALLAARRGTARVRVVLAGALGFGVLEAVSAAMPDFATFGLMLLFTGVAGLTIATTANAVMQTSVDSELRGRVMGVYLLVFMGGTPIGSPLVGWLAGLVGVRWTLALCGVSTALAAIVAAYVLAWRTDRRILASVTSRPHLAVVPRTA